MSREKEMQQIKRLLAEELLTVVAHSLRSYLTTLEIHIDLMQMRAHQRKRQEDLHDTAVLKRVLHRLERLIADLLDVARLDQGLFVLKQQPVNLADLIQETVIAFTSQENEIEVQIPHKGVIVGDPERLRQALENLLANALAHAYPKTPIIVKLTIEQRGSEFWALLSVSNTGPPIPPDLLSRLFQPFVKDIHSKGLGLGLYLAHNIALAHQGTLTLDPSAEENVQFTLSLPLVIESFAEDEQKEGFSGKSEMTQTDSLREKLRE